MDCIPHGLLEQLSMLHHQGSTLQVGRQERIRQTILHDTCHGIQDDLTNLQEDLHKPSGIILGELHVGASRKLGQIFIGNHLILVRGQIQILRRVALHDRRDNRCDVVDRVHIPDPDESRRVFDVLVNIYSQIITDRMLHHTIQNTDFISHQRCIIRVVHEVGFHAQGTRHDTEEGNVAGLSLVHQGTIDHSYLLGHQGRCVLFICSQINRLAFLCGVCLGFHYCHFYHLVVYFSEYC